LPDNGNISIRADQVSRHYQMGGTVVRAVDGVSLAVREGEFLALLGSSGSGKSTLMNLFAGLDRPTAGAIIIQSRNLADMTSLELARYRSHTVGMVFQAFNLLPRMTLEENVELPMRLAEVDRGERVTRVKEALERVHLEKRLKHRPGELSGGEQQRGSLARALVNRPKILLADEPTGNLDTENSTAVLSILQGLNKRLGQTILMITHDPEAAAYADRTVTMRDGRVV
jgi:putative ABC transport system ATP-binding protein